MAINYAVLAQPKGTSRKTVKGRKARAEATQIAAVRAHCAERDGKCRVLKSIAAHYDGWMVLAALDQIEAHDTCAGPSEWAHMHSRRRSQTRNQAPEIRHDAEHSLMLCRFHHDSYDGRKMPRLFITALTRKGADGPLKFRRAK